MNKTFKFSRSHDQCYVDCPRKAFLTYYYSGTGIVKKGLDLYQQTGSLTHAILQGILSYAKQTGTVMLEPMLSELCQREVTAYRAQVMAAGFSEFSGEVELEMQRQAALAEGLARAWARIRLPFLLEHYAILAVEEEHEIPIAEGLVLMSRLDGVLRRREDGELFPGPEFKTTGWISDDYIESWRYSAQTLSHGLDVEAFYGKQPAGVIMEFLYKGMKRKGEDGSYVYYSPLVRAYRMVDSMGDTVYGTDSSLARKKDWKPFDTFSMGMAEWMHRLSDEQLAELLFSTVVYRSPKEVEQWKRQVILRQGRIKAGLEALAGDLTVDAADDVMLGVFPARLDQFCYSNQYKKRCPYLDVCYGKVDDPLESGLFTARTPHHPAEFSQDAD